MIDGNKMIESIHFNKPLTHEVDKQLDRQN